MTTQIRGSDPGASAPPDTMPNLVGEVLDGRYRLEAIIGEGGMGRVYRAEHVRLCRPVAVKVLHAHWSRIPEVVQRFEREAIAVARLDHPNCVSVLDLGRLADGSLFLVMPFLSGALLSDVVKAGRLPVARALAITRHVLAGLAHAHRAGIVHRDIKTANIMLVEHEGDADFAKVLDFGIAKVLDATAATAEEKLTVVGQRFGTPAYMSPEQAIGKEVDHRTDIYSTAVVLFELLTGRLPFESADNLDLMAMQAGASPPTLAGRVREDELSDALEELVARGLAKDPAARYESAAAFKAAVDELVRARTPAPPRARRRLPSPRPLLRKLARRVSRRARIVLAVLTALALAAPLALALRVHPRTDHAARARQLLGEGKPEEAVAYLEQHRREVGEDPRARLELGHAYAAVRRYNDALAAYEHARRVAPSVGDDRTMRTNLMLMLEDERSDIAATAARFLVEILQDDGGRARIVELASRHASLPHRTRMRDVAEQLGLGDRIDRLTSYRLDLQQGKTCPDRQRAVAKLRALGDPAAIPALDKARARRTNACLRADASDAVHYLETKAQAEPSEE